MTVDEIKSAYSMRDVLLKYGFQVGRDGFCSCMLHEGDHTASFKVYPDSFHCYGCGKGGDIINWVQEYLHCDFKTAFYELGGSYERPKTIREQRQQAAKLREIEARRKQKAAEEQYRKDMRLLLGNEITIIREHIEKYEVFSEPWCNLTNELNKLWFLLMELYEGGELGEWRRSVQLAGAEGYIEAFGG